MKTHRGLGKRRVLALLNVGVVIVCQRCIRGVKYRSMYVSV